MDKILPSLPNEIKIAAKERRLLIFLGAGISCAAGLPSWEEVKGILLKKCRDKFVEDPIRFQEISNMPYYECFSEVFRIDRDTYNKELNKALSCNDEQLDIFKKLINTIKKLNPCSIITTNVDDLLTRCGLYTPDKFRYREQCCPQELREDKVFCLHGTKENAVFNRFELVGLYGNPDFKNFLYNVFGSYSVLFLGYSFKDEALRETMRINVYYQTQKEDYTFHYALLPSDAQINEILYQRQFGIRIIRYDNSKQNYENFIPTIESWTGVKPEAKKPRGKKDSRAQVPGRYEKIL